MANEKRLIDANALSDSKWWESLTDDFDKARARIIIMSAPTVDAVEVVHGRWIEKVDMVESYLADCTEVFYECSVCVNVQTLANRFTAPTAVQRWTEGMRMARCRDCLHYDACSAFSKIINSARDVEKGCEHFVDRTKHVEVVRCKDCKRRGGVMCPVEESVYQYPWFDTKDDGFCSYGERRDNDIS